MDSVGAAVVDDRGWLERGGRFHTKQIGQKGRLRKRTGAAGRWDSVTCSHAAGVTERGGKRNGNAGALNSLHARPQLLRREMKETQVRVSCVLGSEGDDGEDASVPHVNQI